MKVNIERWWWWRRNHLVGILGLLTHSNISYSYWSVYLPTLSVVWSQLGKKISIHICMFVPAMIVGLIGGVLGALFAIVNVHIGKLRKKILRGLRHKPLQKAFLFLEPNVIMVCKVLFSNLLGPNYETDKTIATSGYTGPMRRAESIVDYNHHDPWDKTPVGLRYFLSVFFPHLPILHYYWVFAADHISTGDRQSSRSRHYLPLTW